MKILIVDDESAAARMLKNSLISILGSGAESVQVRNSLLDAACFLGEHPIDLLFLDLDVGGRDGFELLKTPQNRAFNTVVVSAHIDRAIEAFEFDVLDFVPKPFSEARLERTIARHNAAVAGGQLKHVAVVDEGSISVVPLEDVCYFEACDKRSLICHKSGRVDDCDKMLKDLEKILPADFVRIHRSFIVAVEEIRRLSGRANGRYYASMRNGDVLPVSRDLHASLKKKLEIRLPAPS